MTSTGRPAGRPVSFSAPLLRQTPPEDARGTGLTDMQERALEEVASIGSGHAATALAELLGFNVNDLE